MLTTLEINAFTDSPRNLTVTASKQGTARVIRLLAVGTNCILPSYTKKLPALQESPEQRLQKN